MSEATGKSALWNQAPVMQDAPLTIFAGLRGLDALLAVAAFFASYFVLQGLTTLRLMVVFLSSLGLAAAWYLATLAVRRMGPDHFHWSFLHWAGLLPIRGVLPARGIRHEPF
jgi:hypothetical protein